MNVKKIARFFFSQATDIPSSGSEGKLEKVESLKRLSGKESSTFKCGGNGK